MRRLTMQEATETDLQRTAFVAVVGGEVLLFRATGGGTTPRYGLVEEGASAYAELERYWALK